MARLVTAVVVGILIGVLGTVAVGAGVWGDEPRPVPVISLEGPSSTPAPTPPTRGPDTSADVEIVPPPTFSPDPDDRDDDGDDDRDDRDDDDQDDDDRDDRDDDDRDDDDRDGSRDDRDDRDRDDDDG